MYLQGQSSNSNQVQTNCLCQQQNYFLGLTLMTLTKQTVMMMYLQGQLSNSNQVQANCLCQKQNYFLRLTLMTVTKQTVMIHMKKDLIVLLNLTKMFMQFCLNVGILYTKLMLPGLLMANAPMYNTIIALFQWNQEMFFIQEKMHLQNFNVFAKQKWKEMSYRLKNFGLVRESLLMKVMMILMPHLKFMKMKTKRNVPVQ